jgi:hypothetical protein
LILVARLTAALAVALVVASCAVRGDGGSDATRSTSQARTVTIVDDFSRVERGAWGAVGPIGWEYTPTSGDSLELSVDGERAVARSPQGVSKGNFLIGPPIDGSAHAQANFSVDRIVSIGGQNHPQVLLKVADARTYYGFQLYPNYERRATAEVFAAKDGRYTKLGRAEVPFAMEEDRVYAIKASVQDGQERAVLQMKAWPADGPAPRRWTLVAVDTSDPIQSGRAGVGLSFQAGPAAMSVDDFSLRAPDG